MQREFKISLSQEHYSDVVYLSQYDDDYDVIFHVTNKYSAADVGGKSAKFTGTRSDGLGFTFTSTAVGSSVSFHINTSLTACAGTHTAEIVFYDSNDLYFGSANVQVIVEKAAHPEGTIDADEEALRELAEQVQEIVDTAAAEVKGEAESWAVGERDGEPVSSDDPTYENNAKYYSQQAAQIAEDISGVTGQVAQNTSDISDLKEDLKNAITNLESDKQYVPVPAPLSGMTYLERYCITSNGKGVLASSTYVTLSYRATSAMHVKLKTTKDSSNRYTIERASVCNADLTLQQGASQGTLQTLTDGSTVCECDVPEGWYFAFSIYCYTVDTVQDVFAYITLTVPGEEYSMPNLLVDANQIRGDIDVAVSANQYIIRQNGYSTILVHETDVPARKDCWTIRGIFNGEDTICPSGTDIIGVLQEVGEPDFMGGLHGDETVVNFLIFGDGIPLTTAGSYKQIDVFMFSHLTRPSTGDNVIDRVVHIVFKDNYVEVETSFICLVNSFSLSYAYNGGMFAWYDADADFQISNMGFIDAQSGTSSLTLQRSVNLYSASASINGHLVTAENIIGRDTSGYLGETYYYGSTDKRIKMYYSTEHGVTWNEGHVCIGKARYTLS